jgi:hypothetical protein
MYLEMISLKFFKLLIVVLWLVLFLYIKKVIFYIRNNIPEIGFRREFIICLKVCNCNIRTKKLESEGALYFVMY